MPRARDDDELRSLVRGAGLRATPPRLDVFHVLRSSLEPLSHAEVCDRLGTHRTMDRSTVFRNLEDLAEVGLARRVDLGDHIWRFSCAVSTDAPLATFVCTTCSKVESLRDVEIVDRRGKPPRWLKQRGVEILVRGRCDACRA